MDIRLIEKSDASLLVPVFDAYRQFHDQDSDEAGVRKYLAAHLDAGDFPGVVAIDDHGKVAGFSLVVPTFSSIQLERVWVLDALYIEPDHRQTGLAVRLMVRLLALAKECGINHMSVVTDKSNTRAQAHYRKMGWKQSEFLRFEREI